MTKNKYPYKTDKNGFIILHDKPTNYLVEDCCINHKQFIGDFSNFKQLHDWADKINVNYEDIQIQYSDAWTDAFLVAKDEEATNIRKAELQKQFESDLEAWNCWYNKHKEEIVKLELFKKEQNKLSNEKQKKKIEKEIAKLKKKIDAL